MKGNSIRLSLIGMAGSGKTHWSRKLEARGFRRFCCDDMIAEKLRPELRNPDGTSTSVVDWMGFPYEDRYEAREKRYLSLEAEVLREIVDYLENKKAGPQENIVVDTTGSVIYMGDDLLEKLSRLTTVVLLETPPAVRERLLEAYVSKPHPMVWKGTFSQKSGESHLDALARCYPLLFASRARLYGRYGTVTIEYQERREESFTVSDFLKRVF
jgi:hypothetical protein